MDEGQHINQYASWNNMAANLAYVCWAVGILIAFGYFVRLATTSDSKAGYDFINRYEINVLWIAAIVLIVSGGFYFNSNITILSMLWVFVRIFFTSMMGMIVALIVQNLLRFYYPFFIE